MKTSASILRRVLGLTLLGLACLPGLLRAAPVEQTDVFVSGQDGYHTYRIPAVIRAKNGDLLAFCEGRKSAGGDSGNIDLLLKRSADGGKTWSAQQTIWDDAENTCGNPCPVLDESTGTLWLLLTHNLGIDHEKQIAARTSKGTRTVWVASSADHGVTWTKPVEITSATKDPSWTWYATGPGVGIQIQKGPHAGRLVIPCDHNYDNPDDPNKRISGSHAIYSDDHGATWKLGGIIHPRVNECQVVELFDDRGTLLMDMRCNSGRNRRAESTSTDGGATWTAPTDSATRIEPVCQASILRHEAAKLLLFSNPASVKRVNLTVRASADDNRTWRDVAVLHPGPSAYSCLVALSPTEAGCLYERGEKKPYEKITFARFSIVAP
ncbi:MAG: exo-alpha-sialidase [Opitutae bacterium]|nr:exo-alpha-sialidase [Opitutae bacterium]